MSGQQKESLNSAPAALKTATAPGATIIIGAGPAGLTAAHELSAAGRPVVIVEQDPEHVGGIARTVSYKGFRFDIGGHRFFSKNAEIEKLWSDILGERL
ncbi:MAG TPA: NAD(P)-binding protein, partial [Candidatus Binataceae bacterium]|nr:NAD(P)-binding protein [Candidatus Binataceae bacterium]